MEIQDLNNDQFVDIFSLPTDKNSPNINLATFGSEETDTNLIAPADDKDNKDVDINQNVDLNATPPAADADKDKDKAPTDTDNPDADADILGEGKDKPGRKPKYDFTDASGYFADRFKSGKFVAIEEELEDGTKRPFVPKTPEEFDEVIDIQVNHQLQQKEKQLQESWYQSKSPAWQAVAKYAEMTDDPAEIIPFLQGVQTINTVADIDENDVNGAAEIIRIRLEKRGEPKDMIEEQIEALKSADRLISTAQKYKPVILKEEQQQLAYMAQQQRQEEEQYNKLVEETRENAIKAIEAPFIGNVKLKKEEKLAIYQLIGEPRKETGGYPIFNEIDALFEKGDFETLRRVALLLSKKESYDSYVAAHASNKTAGDAMRKLKVATDSRAASGDVETSDDRKVTVVRNQYSSPKFGRQ